MTVTLDLHLQIGIDTQRASGLVQTVGPLALRERARVRASGTRTSGINGLLCAKALTRCPSPGRRGEAVGHDANRQREPRGHGCGHWNLQMIQSGLERDLSLLDEPIAVAGDYGQGRLPAPNDLCFGRVAGLESRAIDQQQQTPRIVVAGDGQLQLAGDHIAEAIGTGRTQVVLAAFGQLERLSRRTIGCRGKRMLRDQLLAGGFADVVLPENLQQEFFRAGPICGVARLQADIESLARQVNGAGRFEADREAARGNGQLRCTDSDRDGMPASNVMLPYDSNSAVGIAK